jgi:hypothetical protein
MTITIFSLVCLIGVTLGFRFKVWVLLHAICIALLSTVIVGIGHRHSGAEVILTMVLIAASLQVGYLAGVFVRMITAFSVTPYIIHVFLAAPQRTRRG